MVLTKAMGILPASFRVRLSILFAVLLGCFTLPAAASAACTVPDPSMDYLTDAPQNFSGTFGPGLKGKFVQIPFSVPPGTTGMRISYCYDGTNSDPSIPEGIKNTTLDLGVYEPDNAKPNEWTMNQRRGWSGSAVKTIGIGKNGHPLPYATGNKAYVPGNTSRAYKPGPVPAGKWAVELGAGYIDPGLTSGTNWKIEVITSNDANWADEGFTPNPYTPYVAKDAAGWYAGDLHVHGENEPGNAPMSETFNLGFGDSPSGAGLDFMTLVDHNNDVARTTELGEYRALHPGKLIIPGTEMTTYDGHFNSQNSNVFTDFRLSEILRWDDSDSSTTLDDGELKHVSGPADPSERFAQIQANGGWTQINHPASAKDSPASCRGCAWTYSDARTDFSKVDAIEIATGPTGIPTPNPTSQIPFTDEAIAYYEHALSTGAHVAAVSSSDDHKAKAMPGPIDPTIGNGMTEVYADQLSQSGITAGVKAGHTYAKPFGTVTPDVGMLAGEPGKGDLTAMPGDSVTAPSMNIQLHVSKAGPSAAQPGSYTLEVLKNGVSIDSAAVVGDEFDHDINVTESGRYSFKLTRKITVGSKPSTLIMAYSTPVWFTQKDPPSNKFSFGKVKLNKKKGTAKLQVKVPGKGKVLLAGSGKVKGQKKKPKKKSKVTLTIKAKGKAAKALKKKGRAKIKVKVKFTPTGGDAKAKSKTIKLKRKKSKKRK